MCTKWLYHRLFIAYSRLSYSKDLSSVYCLQNVYQVLRHSLDCQIVSGWRCVCSCAPCWLWIHSTCWSGARCRPAPRTQSGLMADLHASCRLRKPVRTTSHFWWVLLLNHVWTAIVLCYYTPGPMLSTVACYGTDNLQVYDRASGIPWHADFHTVPQN